MNRTNSEEESVQSFLALSDSPATAKIIEGIYFLVIRAKPHEHLCKRQKPVRCVAQMMPTSSISASFFNKVQLQTLEGTNQTMASIQPRTDRQKLGMPKSLKTVGFS